MACAGRRAGVLRRQSAPHECPLRRRRQVPRRPGDERDRRLAADRARFRQAQQGQGRQRPAPLRRARARGAARRGRADRARDRPRPGVGVRARGRVRLRRAGARLLRRQGRRDAGSGRAARPVRRAALLPPSRQGALPQGAGRDRQGGAARHRAQAPDRAAGRRLGRRARRRNLPGADPRAALSHPVQARQERARVQGRRRGVAAFRPGAARPAQGGRRDRLAVRVPLAPLPVRGVPEGRRLRRRAGAERRREARALARGRVLDRRLVDDRDRRRALGAGPRHRPGHARHPHRRAGARGRAGLGGGADRARPPLDGLHPRPQADDAARRRRRRVHARRGPRRRGRLALPDDRRGDAGDAGERDAPRARAHRRQPAPRRARGRDQRGDARRRPAAIASVRRRAHLPARPRAAPEGGPREGARQARELQPSRLQLQARPRRRARDRRRRARRDRAAQARLAARPHRRRGDDPRQQHLGRLARRLRRARHLPQPGEPGAGREGADEHAAGAARRHRRRPVRVVDVAAAGATSTSSTSGRSSLARAPAAAPR